MPVSPHDILEIHYRINTVCSCMAEPRNNRPHPGMRTSWLFSPGLDHERPGQTCSTFMHIHPFCGVSKLLQDFDVTGNAEVRQSLSKNENDGLVIKNENTVW